MDLYKIPTQEEVDDYYMNGRRWIQNVPDNVCNMLSNLSITTDTNAQQYNENTENDTVWIYNHHKWKKYYKTHNKHPLASSQLGEWQSTQRALYAQSKLSQVRIRILNNTTGWEW
jgi:hypothetical protein